MAVRANMTERAVLSILKQLEDERVIVKSREGRRNTYAIDFEAFRTFDRWSPGTWRMPPELVDIAVDGLRYLAGRSRANGTASESPRRAAPRMRAAPSGA
jgi:hypothetical protein